MKRDSSRRMKLGKEVSNSVFEVLSTPGCRNLPMREIMEIAMKKNASNFYVSYEQVRRAISDLERGWKPKKKVKMYEVIYDYYKKNKRPGRYQKIFLEEFLLTPVPFNVIMSKERFQGIFYSYIREKRTSL